MEGVYDLYRKDGNASAGTPLVQAEVADGSVTTAKLDSTILKYLKPEITSQPQEQTVYEDTNVSYSVTAEGKYLTYQWKKDGVDLTGETNATLNITDANATLHDGNYSVVVSNDFGSVESDLTEVLVKDGILNGLVGWWKFDETSGTVAYDSSGNGNDGNLMNGPAWTTGKIGGALSFDGVNDYVNLGFVLPMTYTKVAWVIKTGTSRGNILSYNMSHSFWVDSSGYLAVQHYYSGSVKIADGVHFPLNQWMQVGSTYNADTKTISLFKNGSLVSTSNNIQELSANVRAYVGTYNSSNFWTGLIDDVRIYDRALSAEEVQALYNLGQ